MPITQDRLIRMVELADKYSSLLSPMRAEISQLAIQHNRAKTLEEKDTWMNAVVNYILDIQAQGEDLLRIQEEKLHFKYTRKKNEANARAQAKHRARLKEQTEILYDDAQAQSAVDELFGTEG